MAYEVKNVYVSKELEDEIAATVKERRSVEQLLVEKEFDATSDSLEELIHILKKCMGTHMMLEFVFSAASNNWKEYHKTLSNLWKKISVDAQFAQEDLLFLGQSLHQRGQKAKGLQILKEVSDMVSDTKTAIALANIVNHETVDRPWVKEILFKARENAQTADEFAKIAKCFVEYAGDGIECRKTVEEAVKKAHTFAEYCLVAVVILKSFGDKVWAKSVFDTGKQKKEAEAIMEMLAKDEYEETLAKI